MVKNLVIVESPAKAKTIEKFLGKDYTVTSCYGHIRDLAPDKLSVEVEKNFEPHYEIPDDKKKLVRELKKLAEEAEMIWLATDEDREGEAISWHLKEALGLKNDSIKRIVFHEITKNAILQAIASPRSINENLVDAQQARRVLDRLVGFELSPILWRKIKPALSAGRVQSVAVRLVVDREREIIAHKASDFYKISAVFNVKTKDGKSAELKAELPQKLKSAEEAGSFLNECTKAIYSISDIEVKPAKKSPAAPFTTSTLQQEASRKLGFSVSQTMMVAQKLYEAGHITYMRTDSMNLSELALESAEKKIKESYGEKYHKRRQYATKSKGAQEAHEAIRPTYMENEEVGGDNSSKRLYDLIWKRTIASQMANAELERTTVKIDISTNKSQLQAQGEVLKFEGFLKVYLEGKDDEDEESEASGMLPPLSKGQELDLRYMQAIQRFNRPAARYAEASLVKKLEELGIGRPSTYAPTISTIQKRGYITKENREGQTRKYTVMTLKNGEVATKEEQENFGAEKGKLFPTNIGMVVNDFLIDHFAGIMDFNFTAKVEKEFDEIAEGGKDWQKMLGSFYFPFHKTVEETQNKKVERKEVHLGTHPETGEPMIGKVGRYGPYVQIGEGSEDEKPKYSKLKSGQLLETITVEDALELFKLPRTVGEFEELEIVADIGRFGPYLRHDGQFYSLPKTLDPLEVTEEQAKELISEKREAKKKQEIKTLEYEGKPLRILNGRYGPYISYNRLNVRIPKDKVPEDLTLEEVAELVQNHKKSPPKGKRKAKKKT
ncbi:MAG: type I DNA topoisomerase [Bacteroidia bacterium]